MAYVYGNTVRKESAVPEGRKEVLPKQPKRVSRQVQKNRKNALNMSFGYVVFLAVAAVAMVFICVQYLRLQSEITNRSKNIASLQRELTDLKEENTTKYNYLINSMNLEEIREKAINELGMVYATPEQIVKYKSPTSNAVTQYESIPESGVLAGYDEMKK